MLLLRICRDREDTVPRFCDLRAEVVESGGGAVAAGADVGEDAIGGFLQVGWGGLEIFRLRVLCELCLLLFFFVFFFGRRGRVGIIDPRGGEGVEGGFVDKEVEDKAFEQELE